MSRLHERLASLGVDVSSLSPAFALPEGMLFRLVVPGAEALARWRALRELVPLTGHWPVVLGDDLNLRRLQVGLMEDEPVPASELVRVGEAFDVEEWLGERRDELALDLTMDTWEEVATEGREPGPRDLALPYDGLSGQPLQRVSLALVPTARPWHVPALLRLGGWSDCPQAEVHVALMRHWHVRHGAEVVGVGRDVVELYVPRPAATRHEAERLACEHYAYCPAVVEQGAGSLGALAAVLHHVRLWSFWWD
jgi:Domain of unknown function (DUF4253)